MKKGVIYVAISYRVGIFGYLAHPDLTKESGHNASGNWGMLDQIAALKWVQHNIAAFGGDAANVTLMGQSAGAMSINDLNVSPMAHGLFAKLIGLSGTFMPTGGQPHDTSFPRHPAPRRAGRRDRLCLAPHGRDLRDLGPGDGHEGRPRDRGARDGVGDATASSSR